MNLFKAGKKIGYFYPNEAVYVQAWRVRFGFFYKITMPYYMLKLQNLPAGWQLDVWRFSIAISTNNDWKDD